MYVKQFVARIEPLTGDIIVLDVYLMAYRACPQLFFKSLFATGDLTQQRGVGVAFTFGTGFGIHQTVDSWGIIHNLSI